MSRERKPHLRDTKAHFGSYLQNFGKSFETHRKSETRSPAALSKASINAPCEAFKAGTPLHPFTEEIEQSQFQRPLSRKCVTGTPQPLAQGAQIGAVVFQLPKILFARGAGVDEQGAA